MLCYITCRHSNPFESSCYKVCYCQRMLAAELPLLGQISILSYSLKAMTAPPHKSVKLPVHRVYLRESTGPCVRRARVCTHWERE